jgi:hypothetical protein
LIFPELGQGDQQQGLRNRQGDDELGTQVPGMVTETVSPGQLMLPQQFQVGDGNAGDADKNSGDDSGGVDNIGGEFGNVGEQIGESDKEIGDSAENVDDTEENTGDIEEMLITLVGMLMIVGVLMISLVISQQLRIYRIWLVIRGNLQLMAGQNRVLMIILVILVMNDWKVQRTRMLGVLGSQTIIRALALSLVLVQVG